MFCCARQDLKLKSHLERDTKSTAYLGKINLKLKSYLFDSESPCAPMSLGANVCTDMFFHPIHVRSWTAVKAHTSHADLGALPVMWDSCTSQLALIRFMSESYKDNLYGDVLV